MHEALFYEKNEQGAVTCHLCAHHCFITPERLGICAVRQNLSGTLYTLVYNLAAAIHVDPIEKKPLFHFYPGSSSFSVSTVGCNFHCVFCQNWNISQVQGPGQGEIDGREVPPADAKGIKNIFVTNGYITREPLEMIAPYLHAANVDLKSFRDKTYRRIMGARLEPVLDTLKRMKTLGIWIEVTTLVIPGVNDSEDELRDIARFIALELGRDTPWHISRFHPNHKMADVPSTPIATLVRARDRGRAEGIEYGYTGNGPGDSGEHTYCPACRKMIVERCGFQLGNYSIRDGCCAHCGRRVSGVGM
ncbi:MAG: radical SAM protein [Chitinivibrionia bacterium]|nr:radical SAM protein [Chitinivibrionia bacterium]